MQQKDYIPKEFLEFTINKYLVLKKSNSKYAYIYKDKSKLLISHLDGAFRIRTDHFVLELRYAAIQRTKKSE